MIWSILLGYLFIGLFVDIVCRIWNKHPYSLELHSGLIIFWPVYLFLLGKEIKF